jgi:maleate isomerase
MVKLAPAGAARRVPQASRRIYLVEYARKGLIGVLTPQANTTVEPEFAILLPPGYAFLNARMVSDKPTIEARLEDYFATLDHSVAQFANAPLGAVAFACTGASYLQGVERERAAVEVLEARSGIPFITAGRAVAEALHRLGAQRIGLVSPYPPALTAASVAYWGEQGQTVVAVAGAFNEGSNFHPIYDLSATSAEDALAAIDPRGVDAVLMLGTGMPTLGPILARAVPQGVPILSCMSALAWRSLATFEPGLVEPDAMRRYFAGEGWRERFALAMA